MEIATRDRTKEAYQDLVRDELPSLYTLALRLERDGAEALVIEAGSQFSRASGTVMDDAGGTSSSAGCGPTPTRRTCSGRKTTMGKTTAAIPCSEAVRQLWDYLDNAVAPEDREKVDRHLSFCRRCCGELEFAKEVRSFLAS